MGWKSACGGVSEGIWTGGAVFGVSSISAKIKSPSLARLVLIAPTVVLSFINTGGGRLIISSCYKKKQRIGCIYELFHYFI